MTKNSIAIKTSHCLYCGVNLAGYGEAEQFCENHGGQKIKKMSAAEKFFHLFEKGGEKMAETETKSGLTSESISEPTTEKNFVGLDKHKEELRQKGTKWAEYLRDNPNAPYIPLIQFLRENN